MAQRYTDIAPEDVGYCADVIEDTLEDNPNNLTPKEIACFQEASDTLRRASDMLHAIESRMTGDYNSVDFEEAWDVTTQAPVTPLDVTRAQWQRQGYVLIAVPPERLCGREPADVQAILEQAIEQELEGIADTCDTE